MTAVTTDNRLKIAGIITKIKTEILKINLFPSVPPTEDILTLKKQRFSTYIFLLLFIISLITFTIYTSTVSVVRTETIDNPSYLLYQQLFNQYSQTLSCPCTTIAIPHKEFLQLNPLYHPVCSSFFVQDEWIIILKNLQQARFISIYFNFIAPSFFQMLGSLCLLSKQLVDQELLTFADTVMITGDVMSADLFNEQSQLSIDLLISNMETTFMRLIELVRLLIDIDASLSGLSTNVEYLFIPYNLVALQINTIPRTFQETNCTCSRGTICLIPVSIEIYSM